jgi:hypothetical protein
MADAEAFASFVEARTRPLLPTAWLLTGDWHLAQDLVQESRSQQGIECTAVDGPLVFGFEAQH